MSLGQPRTLQDAYTRINELTKLAAKHQHTLDKSYQMSQGTIRKVSEDRSMYEVQLDIEGILVKDAVLLLDKAYYQIIGFPNVGDFVKVFHKDAFATSYIVARVNDQVGNIVMTKNSCVPMGSNIP